MNKLAQLSAATTTWSPGRSPLLPQTVRSASASAKPAAHDRRALIVAGVIALATLAFLVFTQVRPDAASVTRNRCGGSSSTKGYDARYPKTPPVSSNGHTSLQLNMIADLDKASRSSDKEGGWVSRLYSATLLRNEATDMYSLKVSKNIITLRSQLSEKGRGLELSELQYFNGRLLTVDDRTGIVYEISGKTVVPRHILADGDGTVTKGFKGEWMAVKNRRLYIGGMGKEWTTPQGQVINLNPQWIKTISAAGVVNHASWVRQYNALRSAARMPPPGYVLHESAAWSEVRQRWYFLPRHASADAYDDVADEMRGQNLVLSADADFNDVQVAHVGPRVREHGFSSFKFVPGTRDRHIVALKTQELKGSIASFMAVYDLDTGKVLMPEAFVSNDKLEGVEFV